MNSDWYRDRHWDIEWHEIRFLVSMLRQMIGSFFMGIQDLLQFQNLFVMFPTGSASFLLYYWKSLHLLELL